MAGGESRGLPHAAALRESWWKILLVAVAVGSVAAIVLLRIPNMYRATAVISPTGDESKQNAALGAFASLGIPVTAPSKVEDLETLFKSRDLTIRIFRKYDLWPVLLGDRYDNAARRIRFSWTDRLLRRDGEARAPGDWDAVRAANERLAIAVNKRASTISVSFESPSPEGSADIVRHYLEEGKSRLQEEAFERASRHKKFIEEQIARTVDPLTRDRLYALYGQEVEREMMARNREQFGFKVVDAARAPDRKSRPRRAQGVAAATLAGLFGASAYFLRRRSRAETPPPG